MTRPVTVLIVDDSVVMRQLLTMLLSADPEIEVVGTASDPLIARERIKALNPDVVTLDIEMPNMDGVTFLRKIMELRPMPVVMISTLTQAGAEITLEALEIGAVDFIGKPTHDVANAFAEIAGELQSKIKNAAKARVGSRRGPPFTEQFAPSFISSGAATISSPAGWSRNQCKRRFGNHISASSTSPSRATITASSNSPSTGSPVRENATAPQLFGSLARIATTERALKASRHSWGSPAVISPSICRNGKAT